jgi:peptidoglycan hydrolase CwlO-like protein
MEMPVICEKCNDLVELNETRESKLTNRLLCQECCSHENKVKELLEEIETIQYDLDNREDYMKGDRQGWKNKIKELKQEIKKLGYDYELHR